MIFFVVLIALLFGFLPSYGQQKCKQWEGEHQQLKLIIVDNKVCAICGSCGELLPIRTDWNETAANILIYGEQLRTTQEKQIKLLENIIKDLRMSNISYRLYAEQLEDSLKTKGKNSK